MIALLDRLDAWIDEIPPLPTPQRFGNLSFRTWGKRLEDVWLQIPLSSPNPSHVNLVEGERTDEDVAS